MCVQRKMTLQNSNKEKQQQKLSKLEGWPNVSSVNP